MIHFERKDNKYMIGDTELPTKLLMQYDHEIDGDDGVILSFLEVGLTVWKYPTQMHAKARVGGIEKTIKEFTVFGGTLCARFKGSNIPHSIDCIRPVILTPSV